MTRTFTIAWTAAVLVGIAAPALADNGLTYYAATNPRIIHVPQRGDEVRDSHASVRRVVPRDADDDVAAPVRQQRSVKTDLRPQPRLPLKQQVRETPRDPVRVAAKPQARREIARQEPMRQEPLRRKPFSVSPPEPVAEPEPEPTGPRRALLSAPPPPADADIPLRPTPRFGEPMPQAPEALTTFTPPSTPSVPPVVSNTPPAAPSPTVAAHAPANDDDDDDLPPPGDPRLAPPEPRQ